MRINHFVQADISWKDSGGRFWMDTCAGRDQVAMTVLQSGWAAYESPLSLLVAKWCMKLKPFFIDVGANTGFYSLLALAAGAKHSYAFEPVPEIADIFQRNAEVSELQDRLTLHRHAVGKKRGEASLYFPLADHGLVETSASLNAEFRQQHAESRLVTVTKLDLALPKSVLAKHSVLLKIDVESHEVDVLKGSESLLRLSRPAFVCEILPGANIAFFEALCSTFKYSHFELAANGAQRCTSISGSFEQRDHLFLPREASRRWLDALK